MRTHKEIIEALLEIKERMVIAKQGKSEEELLDYRYYQCLNAKLSALLYVLEVREVIA